MIITEEILRKIVRRALLETIEEAGTNMQYLYHFTGLSSLAKILETGYFETNQWQREKRNHKRFISFTRHRSNLEGFAYGRNSIVRIEIDGQKLSSLGHDIYPYEYYSPNSHWSNNNDDHRTAKVKYQDAYAKNKHLDGEGPYFHQAEESFETELSQIPIKNIITRIDILVPGNLLTKPENIRARWVNSIRELVRTGSPMIDRVFVYTNRSDFNLQTKKCIPLSTFVLMLSRY